MLTIRMFNNSFSKQSFDVPQVTPSHN